MRQIINDAMWIFNLRPRLLVFNACLISWSEQTILKIYERPHDKTNKMTVPHCWFCHEAAHIAADSEDSKEKYRRLHTNPAFDVDTCTGRWYVALV